MRSLKATTSQYVGDNIFGLLMLQIMIVSIMRWFIEINNVNQLYVGVVKTNSTKTSCAFESTRKLILFDTTDTTGHLRVTYE